GGVYQRFAKDQATNFMVAMPFTRVGVAAGGAYDIVSQGAGNIADWRLDRPRRGLDLGQTQNSMLAGGALQWPLLRFPKSVGYPLIASGTAEGARKVYRGEYEKGSVDLLFSGYLDRKR